MNYYQIKVGLNSSQSEIIDRLKSTGAEVIQLSDGLGIKGSQSAAELTAALQGLDSVPAITALDKAKVAADKDATENLKSFMGI